MGWRVLPSVTNFVLVQPPATESAQGVADRLLERGMVVRSYEAGLLVDWLRITVRGVSENDRLLGALDELLDRDRQTGVRGR
jgi:histidinol-phosphate/aromatic aminotransferase/cobyric acid decarboxylase-like protein